MTIINKEILKKYALNYIEKYNSSKKNLKYVLLRKVKKNIISNNENIKKYELDIIEIIKELEDQKIINDDVYANSKIYSYLNLGKSKQAIKYNLLKKGVEKEKIEKAIDKFENEIPNLEHNSAIIYARKKKLGQYGNGKNNKEKDLAKMARAGFNYGIALKVLGFK